MRYHKAEAAVKSTLPSFDELWDRRIGIDPRKPPRKRHFILCLFQGASIVYFGTTTTPENRVAQLEKGSARDFDSYTLLETGAEVIDDLLLELILTHTPKYNDRLPRNWKLISKGALKERGVGGHAVNRAIRLGEVNPVYYNGITYIPRREAEAALF